MNKFQNKLAEIANKVACIPGVKTLLKPLYYPFKEYLKKKNNKLFKKNALSVISEFTSCLDRNNIPYTIAFGTLLGGIREKGFIIHDLDIDLAMWRDERPDNLPQILLEAGFKLAHTFTIEDGKLGLEETYTKKGIGIDIFYFYPAINEHPYCCDFLGYDGAPTHAASMKKHGRVVARRIELPMTKERMLVDFETLKLYAPTNAHELLAFRYGKDYMTPNPQWGISSYDCHIIRWSEVKAIYVE